MKKVISIGILITLLSFFVPKNFERTLTVSLNQTLLGTTIILDAGHGGKDPGATVGGVNEDEINLAIVLELKELLIASGANVILTRDGDYDLAPDDATNVKQADFEKRVEILNDSSATLFISIHGNISLDQQCKGAEAYYRIDDINSEQLATSILHHLKEVSESHFLPKKGDFYLLNNTSTVGALIEVGFLSNSTDLARLQTTPYQEEIAFAIYQGINDFLSILQ